MSTLKFVVVGDGNVGKTCVLVTFSTGSFPHDTVPTVYDNYVAALTVDGKAVDLGLWDTSGQAEYDLIRPLAYPQTQLFLMCFSVVSPDSFNNVQRRWYPEVRHHCPGCPIILVGTKTDLRADPATLAELRRAGKEPVSREQGLALCRDLRLARYVEVSAVQDQRGIKQLFEEAVRIVWHGNSKPVRKKKCILL